MGAIEGRLVIDGPQARKTTRRRSFPAGLLGMLALVIIVESGLNQYDRHLTPLAASNWRQTGALAATAAVRVDVLFFGDSLVKTGLIPAVFEERHRITSYNLALLGAPPPASYFLFRRALDAGATPRAVVIDAMPSILMAGDVLTNPREWAELIGLGDVFELARGERDTRVISYLLMSRFVPSIRYRLDIASTIADVFKSRPSTSDDAVPWLTLHARQQSVNRGGYLNPPTPSRSGADPRPNGAVSQEERSFCYPEMWWGRPGNLVFLERFIALAESRSIPVFFLLPPIHPGVQSERERLGIEATYIALIRRIHKRFPSMVVIDARHSGFDHGLFWDAFHLGREGATALSQGVADVIAARLDGPADPDRWVTLPAFNEAPSRVAIEDVNESRARLRR